MTDLEKCLLCDRNLSQITMSQFEKQNDTFDLEVAYNDVVAKMVALKHWLLEEGTSDGDSIDVGEAVASVGRTLDTIDEAWVPVDNPMYEDFESARKWLSKYTDANDDPIKGVKPKGFDEAHVILQKINGELARLIAENEDPSLENQLQLAEKCLPEISGLFVLKIRALNPVAGAVVGSAMPEVLDFFRDVKGLVPEFAREALKDLLGEFSVPLPVANAEELQEMLKEVETHVGHIATLMEHVKGSKSLQWVIFTVVGGGAGYAILKTMKKWDKFLEKIKDVFTTTNSGVSQIIEGSSVDVTNAIDVVNQFNYHIQG